MSQFKDECKTARFLYELERDATVFYRHATPREIKIRAKALFENRMPKKKHTNRKIQNDDDETMKEDDDVYVYTQLWHAKIKDIREDMSGKKQYHVHYYLFSKSYDEWVDEAQLIPKNKETTELFKQLDTSQDKDECSDDDEKVYDEEISVPLATNHGVKRLRRVHLTPPQSPNNEEEGMNIAVTPPDNAEDCTTEIEETPPTTDQVPPTLTPCSLLDTVNEARSKCERLIEKEEDPNFSFFDTLPRDLIKIDSAKWVQMVLKNFFKDDFINFFENEGMDVIESDIRKMRQLSSKYGGEMSEQTANGNIKRLKEARKHLLACIESLAEDL
ncbi:predicted protein [Chaetoceros tenuissimus]|uniref:MSL3 chromodomain-like domain-containing protein n=1 Tax=Chaetoceros tenuissimus TaxID=426638 RepID=A0AAD3DCG7_9STRA|nr:predicted protein [Chaetoceros tenuissimus]